MGNSRKKTGTVLFIILLIAIIFIAFRAYSKSTDIKINFDTFKNILNSTMQEVTAKEEPQLWEMEYDIKDRPTFATYKDLLIRITLYGITALDKEGNEKWNLPIRINKPLVKTEGLNLMIADIGGTTALTVDQKGVKWQETFEDDIINASINKKGFVTVVHKKEGYKGIVRVYDPEGQEVFKRYITDTFLFFGKVMDSRDRVIISSIDTSGTGATTCIEFTDLLGEPFAALIPRENSVFPFMFLFEDNYFAIANNLSLICFDKDRNEVWEKKIIIGKVFNFIPRFHHKSTFAYIF